MKPINVYEIEYNRVHAAALESNQMHRRILERKQKAIEDSYSKGKAEEKEVEEISKELTEFHDMKELRLYADDVTPEMLVSVMEKNDGKTSIISTEGGIFDTLSGTYSKKVNIDSLLKAYSGDTIRVDRIGRESQSILEPTLTILLMVQPKVMADVLDNKTFRGRGLVARFLFSNPVSLVGHRNPKSVAVPDDVYRNYEQAVFDLLRDESNETIELSPEAYELLMQFSADLEPKLTREYQDIADWAGKLAGNVLRISGLLARAGIYKGDGFLEVEEPIVVSKEIMQNAITLGMYYLNHAKTVFSVMPESARVNKAKQVLGMLLRKKLTQFNQRDVMRNCRSFTNADETVETLNFLESYGYIRKMDMGKTFKRGRPPLAVYLVHPELEKYFSQDDYCHFVEEVVE